MATPEATLPVAQDEKPKNPNEEVVTFDTPIVRGTQTITEVTIRKPRSGELRGVTLLNLIQMDVLALRTVLPRITVPPLTEHELGNMDPADFMACGTAVSSFLLQRSAKEASLLA
ncbi:Phage tail protein E [compost metagenome]